MRNLSAPKPTEDMLDFSKASGPKPKCFVTSTKLSNFLNHEQPPTKKKPFSIILGQEFSHTLDILLPTNPTQPLPVSPTLHYARLHLKPLDLLTNPFFTTYIKTPSPTSNLTLLSQTSPTSPTTLTLTSGLLRLETDKPTFERLGLQGSPIPHDGRKHLKARYAIELNLRLPSMVSGKPGFERVKWAFRNVLDETLTWLVCGVELEGGPIQDFVPVVREVKAEVEEMRGVLTPSFPSEVKEDEAAEVLEWLSLAMAASPRIREHDDADAYLSRYQVPGDESTTQTLSRLRWRGLIPPDFAYKLFLSALKASGNDWVAISATSFSGEAYTILVHDGQALSWEYKD